MSLLWPRSSSGNTACAAAASSPGAAAAAPLWGRRIPSARGLTHEATVVAADASSFAIAGAGSISFYSLSSVGLLPEGTKSWTAASGTNGLGYARDIALATTWAADVTLLPSDLLAATTTVSLSNHGQKPLLVGDEFVVPQTTNGWVGGLAGVSLVDPVAGTATWLGEAPWISAADGEDGPFDLAMHDGELFLANRESGLLRAAWTPPTLTIPTTTTLTSAIHADLPSQPDLLDNLGALLVIGSSWQNEAVVVEACP